jgi:hypothetical protein
MAVKPVEISAYAHTVQKLYERFQSRFHRCTVDEHNEKLRQYTEETGDCHFGLDGIFNNANFPSVLGLSELVPLERFAHQQVPTP